MIGDATAVDIDIDDVAGIEVVYHGFDRQGACVFHRVVEDRRNIGSDTDAAISLIWDIGHVVAYVPEHRVGGGLA